MNDDLDIIDRLVDYHDHISAPSVPVADDLRRGRQRVRRTHGLVAGGIALGVASVVAAVALSTVGTGEHTGPAGPSTTGSTSGPAPDGLGLTAPLVAPRSLRAVRDFGFHVEPVPGFDPEGLQAGWALDPEGQRVSLRWGQIADVVKVDVRYQGAGPPGDVYTETDPNLSNWDRQEEVIVHGVVGHYYEEHHMYGVGAFRALVAWEYAPDSWAYVSTYSDRMDPGPERLRSALVQVARAVSPGGDAVRLPVRADALPSSMPPLSRVSGVSMTMGSGWESTFDFGHMTFEVAPGTVPPTCEGYDGSHVETFVYHGHPGCVNGSDSTGPGGKAFNTVWAVALQSGDTLRTASRDGEGPDYPIEGMRQAMDELIVAPLDDPSAWFDLKSALGD
jgi:hypothetical protein